MKKSPVREIQKRQAAERTGKERIGRRQDKVTGQGQDKSKSEQGGRGRGRGI